MTETEKKFDAIRRTYPETISKDQFYRIAHISKATALHLLQNGLVPCKDSGKKTRRYTIRTDDVITYLIDREIQPEKYGAPDHWYRDRSGYPPSSKSLQSPVSQGIAGIYHLIGFNCSSSVIPRISGFVSRNVGTERGLYDLICGLR